MRCGIVVDIYILLYSIYLRVCWINRQSIFSTKSKTFLSDFTRRRGGSERWKFAMRFTKLNSSIFFFSTVEENYNTKRLMTDQSRLRLWKREGTTNWNISPLSRQLHVQPTRATKCRDEQVANENDQVIIYHVVYTCTHALTHTILSSEQTSRRTRCDWSPCLGRRSGER